MSNYKVFDGTNWIDPCDCNISIVDIAGNFQLLDPNNCVVKYFDGTNWCPITCPCNCPAGYTFNPSTGECEMITIEAAIPSAGVTYNIIAGSKNAAYGTFGAKLYEDITGLTYPLNGYQLSGTSPSSYVVKQNAGTGTALAIQQQSTNNIWASNGSALNGRLNISGIWASNPTAYPINQWLTVKYCITITEEKQYIFALAGDNQVKASIDSTTFNGGGITNLVNLWGSNNPTGTPSSDTYTNPFKIWHMFPITLPVGTHTLELSGMNFGTDSSFGAEFYNLSDVNMINNLMIPTLVTPTNLQPYILFSTESLVTTPPLVIAGPGVSIIWSCPIDTVFSECYGVPSCVTIDSFPCSTVIPLKR